MPTKDDLRLITEQVKAYVQYQRQLGLDGFIPDSQAETAPAPVSPVEALQIPQPEEKYMDKSKALELIRAEIGDCQRCKLCDKRKNIVFGDGNPYARLVFVGEGPGQDEDEQGLPFVGRAGKLLTDIIKAMGFKREEVYICNVVKCRPPGNRNPEKDEIAACEPFLFKQIDVIQPQVIVGLGLHAVQTLLQTKTPISRLRGQFYDYRGTKLMPTFHPAYLLRNPPDKRLVWEDMQKVMAELKTPNHS